MRKAVSTADVSAPADEAQAPATLPSSATSGALRGGDRLKKRGSLQRHWRMSVQKSCAYSVPTFLDLAPRSGVSDAGLPQENKRASVIIYGERGGKQSVRAGTLDALIDVLVSEEKSSENYIEAFIATHNYFIDSQTLMTRLMERFYDGEEKKIVDIFKKWIETYCEDFEEENLLLFTMFLADLRSKGDRYADLAGDLQNTHNRQQEKNKMKPEVVATYLQDSNSDTRAIVERVSGLQPATFDAREIAVQLTIVESQLFRGVPLRQYLHKAWSASTPRRRAMAKELTNLIERSNAVSFWAASSILCASNEPKKRKRMIGLFIEVASYCLGLQNYQTAMQIYSGLNLTPVTRLKGEWKALGKRHKELWFDLNTFFDNSGNFSRYRAKLKASQSPALPWLSLMLSDLTMIEENEDQVKHEQKEVGVLELIHFEKFSMIHDTLSVLKKLLTVPYTFDIEKPKAELVSMVTTLPRLTEKELYDLKGAEGKKKVNDLKKARKTAQKEEKKKRAGKQQ